MFDIEIDEQDPLKFIEVVRPLEPTFGGINLEDIKAPECFYIERKLRERMKIPVFHDNQHGTAIIVAAAVLNAMKVVGKDIGRVKVAVSAGQVVLKLKTAWRDGTSHHVMEPMEFMQRLAALVPRPRLHLIRFHGVLVPNAKLRKAVVPVPPTATAPAHAGDCAHLPVGSAKGRMRWAQLLKRVFDIDIERCPHCSGQLNLIAAIEDAASIARILTHLGLAAQPPPRAPARRVDLFQAA